MHSEKTILVVEDDLGIRRAIVDALHLTGYSVRETSNAVEAKQTAKNGEIDLMLLDLVLPGADGRNILRQLRKEGMTLPVIILTACGFETDRIEGLRDGADDYIVKPFSVRELLARIEAVLRRSPQRPQAVSLFSFSKGTIDFERREVVFRKGNRQELSEKESELLLYLVRHSGRAISREELLQGVWKLSPNGVPTRTIDMHIARLRDKLGDDPTDPSIILTVRGRGYMFQSPAIPNRPAIPSPPEDVAS
ncbi:response regulator transcription factor [Pirellulaceae bacterium SH467]